MLRRNGFLFFIGLLLIIPIVNCGGSSPKSLPVISGTLPNGSVGVLYSGVLTVTGGVGPFTWSIMGLPTTLTFPPMDNGNTVTISGTPLAAATISGTATVTDSKGNSSSAFPFSFMITSTLAITPTTLAQLTVGLPTTQVLTVSPATIGPYTWSIVTGVLPPGLLLSNGTTTDPKTVQTTTNTVTITGTPTTPGSFNFAITVSDSATPPNTVLQGYQPVVANSNANACPAGQPFPNAALPAGTSYAFLLRGFDGEGEPLVIAGSFTIDGNGGITAGDVDFNGFTNGPQEAGSTLDTADSLYTFGLSGPADTRGCLSLVFSTGAAAKHANNRKMQGRVVKSVGTNSRRAGRPEGVPPPPPIPSRIVFQFALGGKTAGIYTTGNIIEFDNADGTGTSATGVMHVQDPTAFNVTSLAPNFAFGLAGWDPAVSRVAIAGSFTLTDGVINPIFADLNDNGTPSGELNGGANSGMINTVMSTGRATASFDIPMPPGPDLEFDSVVYIINANDFYVISADNPAAGTTSLVSGRALATSNTFPAGALNGFSLLASEGFDPTSTGFNVVTIGTAQFSSTGSTATASFTQSDDGVVTTPTFTGTYTVDTTNPTSGRVSFTVATGTAIPPVIYLTSGGDGIEEIQGFSVGTDANVSSGILVTQSATAPDVTSVSGTYAFGSWEDVDGQNGSLSGTAIFAAPNSYSAIEDETFVTLSAPFLSLGTAVNGTFALVPAGTGTITVGANSSVFVTNGEQIFSIAPGTNPNPDAILVTYTNVIAP
jgi:hypothetical protein